MGVVPQVEDSLRIFNLGATYLRFFFRLPVFSAFTRCAVASIRAAVAAMIAASP